MDIAYLQMFMERTGFPEEARLFLPELAKKNREPLEELTAFFLDSKDYGKTDPLVCEAASKAGCSPYSLWLLVLIGASKQVRPLYRDDKVFFDTFADLGYKARECHERYGVWGTFVAQWYPIFYKGAIVKLGRMEYETKTYEADAPVTVMGITLWPGDPLLSIHIPSSGEPFDRETRMESYRLAYDYFGGPLVCVCGSWLLYPGYEAEFPENSNIGDFRKEFLLISHKETEAFSDGWRVFGKDWGSPPEELPEKTSLQRAFKKRLLRGGDLGTGTGVLIFDGENLLTCREEEA